MRSFLSGTAGTLAAAAWEVISTAWACRIWSSSASCVMRTSAHDCVLHQVGCGRCARCNCQAGNQRSELGHQLDTCSGAYQAYLIENAWRPRPESNWDCRFRKPVLYPFELRGLSSPLVCHTRRSDRFLTCAVSPPYWPPRFLRY